MARNCIATKPPVKARFDFTFVDEAMDRARRMIATDPEEITDRDISDYDALIDQIVLNLHHKTMPRAGRVLDLTRRRVPLTPALLVDNSFEERMLEGL